jgi:DNA-binding SARP family transcriptional activator
VLVALLVEANRTVLVDQLMDRIWADRPPQRAREVLYSYLSRLRHTFAVTDDVRLGRRGGGYVLTVDPMAVDLHRFHRLAAQARSAPADETGIALFEEALGLWRGAAFGALDTPWLNGIRDGLSLQRLAVELDRYDLALRCGRHAAVLADLSAAIERYPLDERLASQLIIALYRCGRQADALAQYRQMRHRLSEELGADPGPALQHLHQQILNADPALALPAARMATSGAPPGGVPVPRQLPAPLSSFAGRNGELADLDAIMGPVSGQPGAVVISALSGTAGVGKTALAVHWAHRVADRFPDGQLYVNLRGFDPGGAITTPAEALRGFLEALGVPVARMPPSLDARAGLYRSLLAGRRMLVVLDNARDVDQVRPLLPGSPGCLALVTSRNQLFGLVAAEGAHPITVDLLSLPEARDLLARRLGAGRAASSPQAIDDIIVSCARLPLALAIVAARAAMQPGFGIDVLAKELHEARGRLDAFAGDDRGTDVRAVFSWSYRQLSEQAARMFRLLGLHPGPDITAAAAGSLAGSPLDQVRVLLVELTRAHLITQHSPGRYALHDLLHAYAAEQTAGIDGDDERAAAVRRMLDHYLHTAHTAALLLDPTRDPITVITAGPAVAPERLVDHDQAMAWFRAEHPVLLAAVEQAASSRLDRHAWQLAWTMVDFLSRGDRWDDQAATQRTALAAARRLGDQDGQARVHRLLARAYGRLGHADDANVQLEYALDLFNRAGNRIGQAHTRHSIAELLAQQGRYAEALAQDRQALDLFRAAGHRAGSARALNNIGWGESALGHHPQALEASQQALAEFGDIGDRIGQADAWATLGEIHQHTSEHAESSRCYRFALQLYRELGNRHYEAIVLTHLGDNYRDTGDIQAARGAWLEALAILDGLGQPDADQIRTKLHSLDA